MSISPDLYGSTELARAKLRIETLEAEVERLRQGAADNRDWAQQAEADMKSAEAKLRAIAELEISLHYDTDDLGEHQGPKHRCVSADDVDAILHPVSGCLKEKGDDNNL